jgi:DNA-binding MarR family transcriptional regulator
MFISEKQLVRVLKSNFNPICHWNSQRIKTTVLQEVNLGFGVADVVISKLNSRYKKSLSTLTYFDAVIYRIIETKKKISFKKLQEITRADSKSINRSLSKLIKDSYVNRKDSLLTFQKSYQGVSDDSIAIEAKLKNWRRALDQAFRYKWFAKKSFVVLDSSYVTPALTNINEFKKLNVGLAEIDFDGKLTLHFDPISQEPVDYKMWILLNEILKKRLSRKKK